MFRNAMAYGEVGEKVVARVNHTTKITGREEVPPTER